MTQTSSNFSSTRYAPVHSLILRSYKGGVPSRRGILATAILGLLLAVNAFSLGEAALETFTVDGAERQALVIPI